ncbi:glycosyltransferase [Methylicorpusculum oleiharenae]|uniref:glycosyltransferase n=1 Tax=Methylicorpusculum oleiharenae TaxID=1338687 RepID=UPI00135937CF|nr:glycosyltransferase [Methylicorpusculum oleiharenae]
MATNTSPIALFVYNRPKHTRETVEALLKNAEAVHSDLFIFSDAAKHEGAQSAVNEVRALIHQITGFKTITIIEREKNWGLANSIIDGVTAICDKYGRAIVLEDDLIFSEHFLGYMNSALNMYEDNQLVWHISGWNYPIEPSGLGDAFFWKTMNCWGWATWANRWNKFSKKPDEMIRSWTPQKINAFNLDGTYNFWRQVKLNRKGKINTWAVFWYATIFSHGGLCLNPTSSYVMNVGHDGTGENCRNSDHFSMHQIINKKQDIDLPELVSVSDDAICRIKSFLDKHARQNLAIYWLRKIQMISETYF